MTSPETLRITEYLDLAIDSGRWHCHRCGQDLGPAEENFKKGCLLYARDPREIHRPLIEDSEFTFAPDPNWVQIVEFYCPSCGTQMETEYLPPGHPITHDVAIDVRSLRDRLESGEFRIEDGRLAPNN